MLGRASGGESLSGGADSRLQPNIIKMNKRQIILNVRKIKTLLAGKYLAVQLEKSPAEAGLNQINTK